MANKLSDFPKDFDPEVYKKEAEELGEVVADAMNRGYMNRLRKSHVSVTRAFQEQYTSIGYQLQFGLIAEEEYFEKLAAIRDRYFSKNTQEWYKYTAEIYDYKVKVLETYESALKEDLEALVKQVQESTDAALAGFSDIAQNAEKTLQNIAKSRDKYAAMLDKATGSGTGYDTDVTKIHNYYPNGDTLVITEHHLSDIEKEIEALKAFDETIQALKERANSLNPADFGLFFEELRTLSMEDANRLATLLLNSNDDTFSSYLSAFREKKELTGEIADSFYKDDFDKAAEEIRKELKTAFTAIPEDFFAYGELTGENFKAGFLSQIAGMFSGVEGMLNPLGITLNPPQNTGDNRRYTTTYYLSGSGETVAQQLMSARQHAVLEKLRQGAE